MKTNRPRAVVRDGERLLDSFRIEKSRVDFEPSATIFAQNDRSRTVMYVEKGRVKLFVTSPKGKRAVVAVLDPGEFFGESALAGQMQRTATAQAMTASTIAMVDIHEMRALLHREPVLADSFLSHLLARNGRLESDVVDHALNSTERRLARALVLLTRYPERRRSRVGVPGISQGLLAEMVGTSRSRVNRFMTRFRRLGFIKYDVGPGGGLRVRASLLRLLAPVEPRTTRITRTPLVRQLLD
jgi:CRP/FNR family cyclic AMP-dependent transcriptional regulator